MNRIKPCPAMKDSGVEWLGDVTKHWNVQQLKSSVANVVDQTNYSICARWVKSGLVFSCWSERVRVVGGIIR